jgi:hypothetical protein
MDVTWSTPYREGGGTFGAGGHASLSGPYIATIIEWLQALPTLHPSDARGGSCAYALFYGAAPVFTFHTTAGTVVFAYGDCYEVTMTINGKPRPTLQASPRFLPGSEEFMRQALHVQPPAPSG